MTTVRIMNVLIVDDSPFACKAIARMLRDDPVLHVVGHAHDGHEALRLMATLPVDVITLDLNMPGLDGLGTLERLRQQRPIPVVVLSSAAGGGAGLTIQALELGAFDVVAKPAGGPVALVAAAGELVAKLRVACGLALAEGEVPYRSAKMAAPPAGRPSGKAPPIALVVLATSTGGPAALNAVVPALPADFPVAVLVLQHMPPGFTRALAERLDRISPLAVREAADGDALLPGSVLVAPAGKQVAITRTGGVPTIVVLDECPFPSYYRPCIDFTLQEAAREMGAGVLAVVLTGMGVDGAAGLGAIKAAGGLGWAQDEATSTIYGMPRAAFESGSVDEVLPLQGIAPRLVAAVGR